LHCDGWRAGRLAGWLAGRVEGHGGDRYAWQGVATLSAVITRPAAAAGARVLAH